MAPTGKFKAVDGEGADNAKSGRHDYFLLAASGMEPLVNPDKSHLSMDECLEYLTDSRLRKSKNVFFSMGYDVNMIFRDLRVDLQATLFHAQDTWYTSEFGDEYKLFYIPKKILRVTKNGRTYIFYDVWSFFAKSFEKTCEQWKLEPSENIKKGKAGRGNFQTWNVSDIIRYNDEELSLLVRLMDKLDSMLIKNDLIIQSYHGPGSVASFMLDKWGIKEHYPLKDDIPGAVKMARRRATFGGRNELLKRGRYIDLHHYDVNSAYPTAMRELPSLAGKEWFFQKNPSENFLADKFGVVNVEWNLKGNTMGPFPFRTKQGYILFPERSEYLQHDTTVAQGSYHIVEALEAKKHFPDVKITAAYFIEPPYEFPLAEKIEFLAKEKSRLKREEGELAAMPLKLAMNSFYGKIGQKPTESSTMQPRYRELLWSGFITAHCRARLMQAAFTAENGPDDMILFATDGVYSLSPLDVNTGGELGQWEYKRHKEGVFFLSGVYVVEEDGKMSLKTRGYSDKFDWQACWEYQKTKVDEEDSFEVMEKRFLPIRQALKLKDKSKMCSFIDQKREINWDKNDKRIFMENDVSSPNSLTNAPVSYPYLDRLCKGKSAQIMSAIAEEIEEDAVDEDI